VRRGAPAPTAEQDELLYAGDQCARLINMENYRRRQLFFAAGIDEGVKVARELRRASEYQEVKRVLGSRTSTKR
jgi:hypothetical protein